MNTEYLPVSHHNYPLETNHCNHVHLNKMNNHADVIDYHGYHILSHLARLQAWGHKKGQEKMQEKIPPSQMHWPSTA